MMRQWQRVSRRWNSLTTTTKFGGSMGSRGDWERVSSRKLSTLIRYQSEFKPEMLWKKLGESSSQRQYNLPGEHKEGEGLKVAITNSSGVMESYPVGTKPIDVLEAKSQRSSLLTSLFDGEPWDLRTPLVKDGHLTFIAKEELTDSSGESSPLLQAGNLTVWRSSAILLSLAMTKVFGDRRVVSLSNELEESRGGFFSDFLLLSTESNSPTTDWVETYPDESFVGGLTPENLEQLSTAMNDLIKRNLPFQKLTIPTSEAIQHFGATHFSSNSPDQVDIWYLDGKFFKCQHPLVLHTGQLKVIDLTNSECVHFKDVLPPRQCVTRVYGIGFVDNRAKLNWQRKLEKAKASDHRVVGQNQRIFMTHQFSPGAPFFLTHGTRVIQRLQEFLRRKYRKFGFEEVMTPLVYKKDLWKISGHWDNYQEDMFSVSSCCGPIEGEDNQESGLKPMNCPAHCLIFDSVPRSERDLPIRFADFGALHRNEASGALSGLTRVRQFHQDDGHIFCRPDQIAQEISSSLQLLREVYHAMDLPDYVLSLSTRPTTNFIGSEEEWNQAEDALKGVLDATGQSWFIKEGDGAFYGPKIDIMVKDALGRSHQTATIQLDFQLPNRFGLRYKLAGGGTATPVIVHRAVFGSIERILAILMEHHSGRWPFWLNPRQVLICPTGSALPYAESLLSQLHTTLDQHHLHLYIDLDRSGKSLSTMIKAAQKAQYSYMVIVGDREVANQTVTVRSRDGKVTHEISPSDLIPQLINLQKQLPSTL